MNFLNLPPDPGVQLHVGLVLAIYALGTTAVLLLISSMTPWAGDRARSVALMLFGLGGLAYGANDLHTLRHSPEFTVTGPLIAKKRIQDRYSHHYNFQLSVNGVATRKYAWFSPRKTPDFGDVVAVTVKRWDQSDVTNLQVLSGTSQGYQWHTQESAGIATIPIAPSLIFFFIGFFGYIKYTRIEQASRVIIP